ncbi:MAG: DndE family protein [Flavobacteriales bacterium]
MEFNIKTAPENKPLVRKLTQKMGFNSQNHIARIALAHSLRKGHMLDLSKDLKASGGQEYKDYTLFGDYKAYYIALICERYQIHKGDANVKNYLKMHIDSGLARIHRFFEENEHVSGMDFLLDHIASGIDSMHSDSLAPIPNKHTALKAKESCVEPLKIEVGTAGESKIYFTPNDTSKYANCHIAIAGQSGVGKSHFARKILEQIVERSKGKVNFLYLDFKGLHKSDRGHPDFKRFFNVTKARLIDTSRDPFPVNPLSFIDRVNERNKTAGIRKFADTVTRYAHLGRVQKQCLIDAVKGAFEDRRDGTYPTLAEVLENVYEIAGDKASSLTEILTELTEIELFDDKKYGDFIHANYYWSLAGNLGDAARFTAAFSVISYLYNTFCNMDEAPMEKGYSGLRYALLVDEAHSVFKEKKSQQILEKFLREVRARGIAVMLVSQGIDEFNQPDFDFAEQCRSTFLMPIKGANWRSISRFLGAGEKHKSKINRAMEAIGPRQAISNIEEFKFEILNTI